jgi:hypothetical protein
MVKALLRFVLLLALLAACKQGENERCQIDDDCDDGLQCSNNRICVSDTVSMTPDSTTLTDARPDGPVVDGGPDAETVDGPDAASDAGPIDSLLPDLL